MVTSRCHFIAFFIIQGKPHSKKDKLGYTILPPGPDSSIYAANLSGRIPTVKVLRLNLERTRAAPAPAVGPAPPPVFIYKYSIYGHDWIYLFI